MLCQHYSRCRCLPFAAALPSACTEPTVVASIPVANTSGIRRFRMGPLTTGQTDSPGR
jgi:hypothetical protein